MKKYVGTLSKSTQCRCQPPVFNKQTPGQSGWPNQSRNGRISQSLQQTPHRGKVFFGNAYLGQPISVNYLGRTAGMPGGSGGPPTNRFY